MQELKIGDIVELKSGGPAMTIISFNEIPTRDSKNLLQCKCEYWNDALSKFVSRAFLQESLKRTEASLF